MIRGFRWVRVVDGFIFTRLADGRQMATINPTLSGEYRWHVRHLHGNKLGFALTVRQAKRDAEQVVKGNEQPS